MGIIAGFMTQNVLKLLLCFGEPADFLGYNAFTDFFPKYPMIANPECINKKCCELQKYYSENPDKVKKKQIAKEDESVV